MVTTMTLLKKLQDELRVAMAGGKYEKADGGLYFHPARIFVGGTMSYRINDGPRVMGDNTATFEGLTDILSVYFKQTAQRTAFFFAPYVNNVAPDGTLTAATFNATMLEFVNYTSGSRLAWTPGVIAAQSLDNTATSAQLVVGTGGGTIRGAGLSTAGAKAATTGVLPVCAAFDTAAVLTAGSKLNLEYVISAQDV